MPEKLILFKKNPKIHFTRKSLSHLIRRWKSLDKEVELQTFLFKKVTLGISENVSIKVKLKFIPKIVVMRKKTYRFRWTCQNASWFWKKRKQIQTIFLDEMKGLEPLLLKFNNNKIFFHQLAKNLNSIIRLSTDENSESRLTLLKF